MVETCKLELGLLELVTISSEMYGSRKYLYCTHPMDGPCRKSHGRGGGASEKPKFFLNEI